MKFTRGEEQKRKKEKEQKLFFQYCAAQNAAVPIKRSEFHEQEANPTPVTGWVSHGLSFWLSLLSLCP